MADTRTAAAAAPIASQPSTVAPPPLRQAEPTKKKKKNAPVISEQQQQQQLYNLRARGRPKADVNAAAAIMEAQSMMSSGGIPTWQLPEKLLPFFDMNRRAFADRVANASVARPQLNAIYRKILTTEKAIRKVHSFLVGTDANRFALSDSSPIISVCGDASSGKTILVDSLLFPKPTADAATVAMVPTTDCVTKLCHANAVTLTASFFAHHSRLMYCVLDDIEDQVDVVRSRLSTLATSPHPSFVHLGTEDLVGNVTKCMGLGRDVLVVGPFPGLDKGFVICNTPDIDADHPSCQAVLDSIVPTSDALVICHRVVPTADSIEAVLSHIKVTPSMNIPLIVGAYPSTYGFVLSSGENGMCISEFVQNIESALDATVANQAIRSVTMQGFCRRASSTASLVTFSKDDVFDPAESVKMYMKLYKGITFNHTISMTRLMNSFLVLASLTLKKRMKYDISKVSKPAFPPSSLTHTCTAIASKLRATPMVGKQLHDLVRIDLAHSLTHLSARRCAEALFKIDAAKEVTRGRPVYEIGITAYLCWERLLYDLIHDAVVESLTPLLDAIRTDTDAKLTAAAAAADYDSVRQIVSELMNRITTGDCTKSALNASFAAVARVISSDGTELNKYDKVATRLLLHNLYDYMSPMRPPGVRVITCAEKAPEFRPPENRVSADTPMLPQVTAATATETCKPATQNNAYPFMVIQARYSDDTESELTWSATDTALEKLSWYKMHYSANHAAANNGVTYLPPTWIVVPTDPGQRSEVRFTGYHPTMGTDTQPRLAEIGIVECLNMVLFCSDDPRDINEMQHIVESARPGYISNTIFVHVSGIKSNMASMLNAGKLLTEHNGFDHFVVCNSAAAAFREIDAKRLYTANCTLSRLVKSMIAAMQLHQPGVGCAIPCSVSYHVVEYLLSSPDIVTFDKTHGAKAFMVIDCKTTRGSHFLTTPGSSAFFVWLGAVMQEFVTDSQRRHGWRTMTLPTFAVSRAGIVPFDSDVFPELELKT